LSLVLEISSLFCSCSSGRGERLQKVWKAPL
jgi:hypothetical protein